MRNSTLDESQYYVYIISNHKNGTLYTGSTNNILRRTFEHKSKYFPRSFTARYNLGKLVYYETHEELSEAILREKQIKNLVRRKKISLIEANNPNWNDLYDKLIGPYVSGVSPRAER